MTENNYKFYKQNLILIHFSGLAKPTKIEQLFDIFSTNGKIHQLFAVIIKAS